MQQLTLQNEEQARSIQQKDELFQQRGRQLQQLQTSRRENEQVVAALQQKDAVIRAKDELLQGKEREIRELQQRVREREGSGVATGPLKLEWRDGPPAPFPTCGRSVATSREMVYSADDNKVLMINSRTLQWRVLPECPKMFFSIAVVNGQLTAIGGKQSYKATNTLLILPQDRPGIFQQKWIEQFPPMTYCRYVPAVTTTNTSLIVAGGSGPDWQKSPVEVMDIQTLQWFTVASLPLPFWHATATICGDRLYIGGGYSTGGPTKSVVMCEVKDLLQSQPQSLATRLLRLFSSHPVWKEVAPLPVVRSSLVTFQGQLLAVGGSTTGRYADVTSDVMQYDVTTDSWNLISQMKVKRQYFLAAPLPNNTLMVCGGLVPNRFTARMELASV